MSETDAPASSPLLANELTYMTNVYSQYIIYGTSIFAIAFAIFQTFGILRMKMDPSKVKVQLLSEE